LTLRIFNVATYSGAELDLFFMVQGRRYGMEFKFNEAPIVTKSMRIALDTLHLDHLWIIYPGLQPYPAHDKISVQPLRDLAAIRDQWRQI